MREHQKQRTIRHFQKIANEKRKLQEAEKINRGYFMKKKTVFFSIFRNRKF